MKTSNMLQEIITVLKPFEASTEESIKVTIDNKPYTLYRCDENDYLAIFSPRVIERVDNYYLIVDEIAEEMTDDYWIQSPSGDLYYLV